MNSMDTPRTSGARESGARGGRGTASPRTVFALSDEETYDLGRTLGRGLKGGEIVLLEGELGAGKTTFTRGLAAGAGADPDDVSSPSYTLVQEYRGARFPLFHVDLYRLDRPEDDLASIGIEEILSGGGVVVVEWGERLPPYLRRGAMTVRLLDMGEGSRRIEIDGEPRGPEPRPRGDA